MNKSASALTLALSAIVLLLLALPTASTPMRPIQAYRTYLPVIAQDSPWREPVGFEGRCFGWYENREKHGWYCARVERFYDDERNADRLRIYGAAVQNGNPEVGQKLVASTPESWCFGFTDDHGRARCDIKYIAPGPVTVRVFVGNASFRVNVD